MTRFFVFIPVEGEQYFGFYYRQILDFFKHRGMINLNTTNNYKKHSVLVAQADCIVLESSIPDIEVGYLVCKALELNKPVIALYLKGHLPDFLSEIKDEKFSLVEYSEDNIGKKLEIACEKAKQSADKRFNFFISPKLLNYLNEETKRTSTTKSAFIRELILEYSKSHQKS